MASVECRPNRSREFDYCALVIFQHDCRRCRVLLLSFLHRSGSSSIRRSVKRETERESESERGKMLRWKWTTARRKRQTHKKKRWMAVWRMCSVQRADQQPIGAMFHASFWSLAFLYTSLRETRRRGKKSRLQSTIDCYCVEQWCASWDQDLKHEGTRWTTKRSESDASHVCVKWCVTACIALGLSRDCTASVKVSVWFELMPALSLSFSSHL